MEEDNNSAQDYEKPVAYDAEGHPLYAHPITTPKKETSGGEAVSSSELSVETQLKHETSKKYYPNITLTKGEYVISAIRRHPVGIIVPFVIGTILTALLMTVLFNYDLFIEVMGITGPVADSSVVVMPVLFLMTLVIIATYVSYFVYTNNRFFITNESIIQDVQIGLFSHREQIISLDNVQDASYHQRGIIQQFLNYGSIRVRTENDKTDYHFTFVLNPREYLKTINSAIDNMKSGKAN